MKTVSEYIKSDKVIKIKWTGDYPTESQKITEVMELQKNLKYKYSSKKFIIDCREVNYPETISNILEVTNRIKESDIDDTNVVMIFDFDSESYKNYRLTLTEIQTKVFLGKNNINIKVFENFEEGLNWLRKIRI